MMKKIICILSVLLLCAAFAGGVSAFTYDKPATVTPSGALSPGETVTASMTIKIPAGTINSGGSITLSTDLDGARWLYDIYIGGAPRSSGNPGAGQLFSITGWMLEYEEPVELKISLTGNAPSGKSPITVMTITQTPAPTSGESTYSTPTQVVRNPDNYDSDIANLKNRVNSLDSRLVIYKNYTIDVGQAQTFLNTAKSKLTEAERIGLNDVSAAYSNIEAADEQLLNAEKYMAGSALNYIKFNTDQIKENVVILEEKGRKNEAALIASANQGIVNLYQIAKSAYDAGSVPDVDTNLYDSFTTLEKSNGYVEEALKNPFAFLLNFWWVILIAAGVAAVIAVVVIIATRKKNAWDELG